MFAHYLQQLRSVDPTQRREAILALGKAGDPRALNALAHVYKTDPDPLLRELAARAGRHIRNIAQQPAKPPPGSRTASPAPARPAAESMWPAWALPEDAQTDAEPVQEPLNADGSVWRPSWQSAREEESLPDPDPAAFAESAQFVSPQRRKIAQGQLRQAFNFRAGGDAERALDELGKAVQTDPALVRDVSVQRLAVDLMGGIPPRQAIAALLERVRAGTLQTSGGGSPVPGKAFRSQMIILSVEIPILFVVLLMFVIVYAFRIRNAVAVADVDFILPQVLATISPALLSRALPIAAGSLVSVLFFLLVVYVVGIYAGGTGTLLRFATVMIGVQIVVFLVIGVGMLVVQFAIFVPTGVEGQYLVRLNLGWVFIGGLWVLLFESYFVGRAHHLDIYKGGAISVVGLVAASILGGLLGLFRGTIFG